MFLLTSKKREKNEHIYILDIQNSQNNTSRSAFRIYEIKRVFREAYASIIKKMISFREQKDPKVKLSIKIIEDLLY